MNLNPMRPLGILAGVMCLTLLLVGCGTPRPKPVAWKLDIQKKVPVEVDVVAVTARDKAKWDTYSMDKYWSPGDGWRRDAEKVTSPASTAELKIARKDPKWKLWLRRGVSGVYVIANLPGNFEGPVDSRREYLPLDKRHWDPLTKGTLEVEVLENRIRLITPEKPQ